MDDALLVRGLETRGDLRRVPQGLVRVERPAVHHVGDGLAVDELHDERRPAVGFFEMVNLGDVRIVQRRQRLRFAPESGKTFRVTREGVWQDFDGHVAPELRIARAIHLAHAAFTNESGDLEGAEPVAG